MNKNTTIVGIVLAVVVLGGAALWVSMKSPAAPGTTNPEIAPVPALATSSAPTAGAPAGAPAPTAQVVGQTVWRDITAADWKIVFKVQTVWKVGAINATDQKLSQVSIGADTSSYFVSRNIALAEPSKLSYTTATRTIAGKSVAVHVYTKPTATKAFYYYFSLPVGTDTYYFRVESTVPSTKVVDDFIGFIAVK